MYEIIANPEDYQIDHLINGTGSGYEEMSDDERSKWADEIKAFTKKIEQFAEKSKELATLLTGTEKISTTPASLKTLKIQLFTINDALNSAMAIADKLEADIIKK